MMCDHAAISYDILARFSIRFYRLTSKVSRQDFLYLVLENSILVKNIFFQIQINNPPFKDFEDLIETSLIGSVSKTAHDSATTGCGSERIVLVN